MRKIIFNCVGNILLFTLLGLAFANPFSSISQTEYGFSANITVFPFLLGIYMIAYPIIYFIVKRKFEWSKDVNSEMAYSDERERVIVGEASKTAYQVLVGGLITIIAAIGGIRFFSLFTNQDISIYAASILLLTMLLVITTISYCIRWCLEYKK